MSASGKSNVTDENLDKYSVELIWRRYTGHMETGKAWKDELKVVLFRQKYGVWWVCKLNTDLGTLGARYLLHLVDEWNSGRKLSFAYTFSAIVMVSGDDAGSHGVFFIQGYGTGRDRIVNINTVNIGVNLECRLTAEMDVYIRNATVPVGISAFMLLGKLPIVSK